MQEDSVPIQNIVTLEVVQEQQSLGAEGHGALHSFGSLFFVSN